MDEKNPRGLPRPKRLATDRVVICAAWLVCPLMGTTLAARMHLRVTDDLPSGPVNLADVIAAVALPALTERRRFIPVDLLDKPF